MTLATGTVTAVSAASVTIEFDPQTGCSACVTGAGCGLGPILRLLAGNGSRTVHLPNRPEETLREGERVQVVVRGRRVAALAVVAYGLPVVGVMAGAGIAVTLWPEAGDVAPVAGALTGAALAWLWLRFGGIGRGATQVLRSGISSPS